MAASRRPEIIAYSDYRDFLKDRFDHEKLRRKAFTFQFCATRLGTSKAYLKLIIEKKRHTSMSKLSLIGSLFRLDSFEQQFFTVLFLKTASDDLKLREYFDGVLGRLKHRLKYAGSHDDKESPQATEVVFRGWLSMAIHSLARFKDFKPEVSWIEARLTAGTASPAEIKLVLEDLLANGSIRQKEGVWQPDEFVFRTPAEFDGDQFKIYKIGVRRTNEALDAVQRHRPSHYHMMSIGLTDAAHEEALQLYVEFRNKLISLSKRSKTPDKVFFLSNNIFCVARQPAPGRVDNPDSGLG